MGARIIRLPQIAASPIAQVLDEFLANQRERLKPSTLARYQDVVELLQHHLNGYAYQALSPAESALFDKYFQAEGEEHREFCQLFGPDKIIENLQGFLRFFMVRKVVAGETLKRAAGTVTKKLSKWLAERGYIPEDAARKGSEEGAAAARELPRSERAARILVQAADRLGVDPEDVDDEDYLDFDHYTIAKLGPEGVWLKSYEESGDRTLGPVVVPETVTELLQEGWDISCAVGRIHGSWRIVEMGNVYPV